MIQINDKYFDKSNTIITMNNLEFYIILFLFYKNI